jgi:acetylornithine deacetylase/succinyl-diaminopimelate desuccinylase-like protein
MRESDDFSHGLDERVPIGNIAKSLEYFRLLLTELSSK